MKTSRIDICQMQIDDQTMSEAVDSIERLVLERKPVYVVTPNVDHVVRFHKNAEFRSIYQGAALVLPDGAPILWGGHFLGTPFKEKVSGSDLTPAVCQRAAEKGYKLFFFGGREGAVEKTKEKLERQYPQIRIAGVYSPPFGFEHNAEENAKAIRKVQEAAPDILFLGLGTPKQEKWIYKHRFELGVPVSVGVGATFEFMAGLVERAPLWMQKCGLEWFWRLLSEPKRLWRRYLIDDPIYFWLLFKQKFLRHT